jgi:aspartate aminotransferase-like enzyme
VRRNGWFGYRWRQILEMGQIPAQAQVLKAQKTETGPTAPFSPALLQEVLPAIRDTQPAVVLHLIWRPRLDMMLPYAHRQSVSEAVHTVGGLVALDCIASGAMWIDMAACGVGVLISALQKGWSGSVMLNSAAHERIEHTTSTSFGCDLHKWRQIMQTYESGGHPHHATLPTDAPTPTLAVIQDTQRHGLGMPCITLARLSGFGMKLQIAASVPWQCDEGADYRSFRIGLMGLDKLLDVDATVARLACALKIRSALKQQASLRQVIRWHDMIGPSPFVAHADSTSATRKAPVILNPAVDRFPPPATPYAH